MRILAVTQGNWGSRKVDNIRRHGPPGWAVDVFEPPRALPPIVDEPDEFLPPQLPTADLVLYLGESPLATQLRPAIASKSGARAVIAPIDNSAWLPPGLQQQLQRELDGMGVASVFPRPFCTLTPESYNYRRSAIKYDNELIARFARHFGQPQLRVSVNPDTGKIESVEVLRDAGCGSARHVAQGLVGVAADEAEFQAGMLHHHYPCLASMEQEQIDDRLRDTLMHVAGYIVRDEVGRQVQPYKTPPRYMTAEGYMPREEEDGAG